MNGVAWRVYALDGRYLETVWFAPDCNERFVREEVYWSGYFCRFLLERVPSA